ncbi:MAG: cytidylyltransferase domain-containing protein [Thermonemataceae bacterium]
MKSLNTICIIPARGGSKRIPRKNILPLNGKPLLTYTLQAAKEAQVFSKVLVSTEDGEIAALAKNEGIEVDNRPEIMSGDKVTKVQVIAEFLERTKAYETFDAVACLLPTCPFRTAQDVKNAYQLFCEHHKEIPYLVGVVEYDFPIQLALTLKDHTASMENEENYLTTRSQNITKRYHPNGAIYLATMTAFSAKNTFFNPDMLAYVMPPERSFDIDYPYQFQIAEHYQKWLTAHDDTHGT